MIKRHKPLKKCHKLVKNSDKNWQISVKKTKTCEKVTKSQKLVKKDTKRWETSEKSHKRVKKIIKSYKLVKVKVANL